MPSARELLEQADALMRRNRGAEAARGGGQQYPAMEQASQAGGRVEPGLRSGSGPTAPIPGPAPAHAVPAGDHRPAQVALPAGGALRDDPVLDPVPPPADSLERAVTIEAKHASDEQPAAPGVVDRSMVDTSMVDGAGGEDDDFPVLTEAVALPEAAPTIVAPGEPTNASSPPVTLEDVPLLTDAVEEIEAPSLLDIADDDVSIWHEALTGTLPEEPAHPIVLPPAQRVVPAAAADADAIPLPDTATADAATAGSMQTGDIVIEEIDASAIAASDAAAASDTAAVPDGDASDAAAPDGAASDGAASNGAASDGATAESIDIEARPAESGRDMAYGGRATPEPPRADRGWSGMNSESAHVDARWSEMAEEIRMQVLQRIDLFTDTGLREQLATRLQPIVDRAAADLVSTINQHVGVILRAYVSEAIEREIERWRSEGR